FTSLAFSPRRRELLAAGGWFGAVQLWDLEENSGTSVEAHRGPVTALAFSPDGNRLASGSGDKSILLWDVGTGNALTAPPNLASMLHQSVVERIAFSPDGHLMASSTWGGEVALWEELKTSTLVALACEIAGRNLTEEEWHRWFGDETFRISCPVAAARNAD